MPDPTGSPSGSPSKDERNWAMIAHLSALLFLWSGIGGVIGPLIVYLIRKDDMPFAAQQAKEACNFQITMLLLGLVAWFLILLIITLPIGLPMLFILGILDVVLTIVAAVKVSEGVAYRYPFNLRLIS